VLVVDAERRLVGTITDGDIRRAVLASMDLSRPVTALLARKLSPYKSPITATIGQEPSAYLHLLRQHKILHLPLLDEDGRVVRLMRMDDFVPNQIPGLQAVIMAGGAGARLHPLTEDTPKPMLPVGGRPLMEIIIGQLKQAGIGRVHVTMHYRPEKITEHFGDGQSFGVELTYVREEEPLGTIGALGLMNPPQETLLVINGDILTHVDFRAMLAYHREHQAELTLAVRQYELTVPYGVVECDGPTVARLVEKPSICHFVNAGIYLLEPSVHQLIPRRQRFDMTELIQRLIEAGRPVVSFPVHEYWLDIGHPQDYEQAQEEMKAPTSR
jgi:NDP-sugar pyrophosphorylase family protein